MKWTLLAAVAAACCLAGAGAHAQASLTAYRFDLTWSGVGFNCYYKDLCDEVEVSGGLPITTLGETGTFHQDIGTYDFTIVTAPDSSNPALVDATISGTFQARSLGGAMSRYAFYADSTDRFAGYLYQLDGNLLGFVGDALITPGAAIPEPPSAVLLLAALAFVGGVFGKRMRQGDAWSATSVLGVPG